MKIENAHVGELVWYCGRGRDGEFMVTHAKVVRVGKKNVRVVTADGFSMLLPPAVLEPMLADDLPLADAFAE